MMAIAIVLCVLVPKERVLPLPNLLGTIISVKLVNIGPQRKSLLLTTLSGMARGVEVTRRIVVKPLGCHGSAQTYPMVAQARISTFECVLMKMYMTKISTSNPWKSMSNRSITMNRKCILLLTVDDMKFRI